MRLAAAVILALLHASPALAKQIGVRSGEHQGFTRVVLDLPSPLGWELESSERVARLTLSPAGAGFDLARTFERISRTRLRGISEDGPGRLRFDLGCACDVEAHLHDGRMLVVDISDPVTEPGAVTSVRVADGDAERPGGLFALPLLPDRVAPGFDAAIRVEPGRLAGLKPVGPSEDAFLDALGQAEIKLAAQLGRATAQGMLQAGDLPAAPAPSHGLAPPPPMPPADAPRPRAVLHAQTETDRATARIFDKALSGHAATCPPEEVFDIGSWAPDKPFALAISEARQDLSDERDRPRPEAVETLVRTYLHYGFGAEALQMLSLAGPSLPNEAIYTTMARVLEHGHAPAAASAGMRAECSGPAALWSYLAKATPPPGPLDDEAALQRAFAMLPPHLKSHLGAVLADRLLQAGHAGLADDILRTSVRQPADPASTQALATARVDLALGRPEQAGPVLADAIDAGGGTSPEALVSLIDMLTDTRRPVETPLAELAAAFSVEHRGTPVGVELERVHVMALSGSGQHDAAVTALEKMRAAERADQAPATGKAAALASPVFEALAGDPDDILFLKHALGVGRTWAETLPAQTGNALARRLLGLGFPEAAAAYLQAPDDGPASRERRLLRAQAALAIGRPTEAELELVGLDGPDALQAQAWARSLKGDHGTAARIYADLDETEQAQRAAWLAEDWAALRGAEDSPFAGAAALAGQDQALARGDTSASLANGRALLDESAAARQTLDALLSGLSSNGADTARP